MHAADFLVIALADGAGSAARSHEGAALAVTAALGTALDALSRHVSAESAATEACNAAIAALAGDTDLACTLTLAVADAQTLAVLHVGDSPAFVIFDEAARVEHLEAPPVSEFPNETMFLTSRGALPVIRTFPLGDVAAVVVASDGLTPVASRTVRWCDEQGTANASYEPHLGFFAPLLAHARAADLDLAALLAHLVAERRVTDDVTVVVATLGRP